MGAETGIGSGIVVIEPVRFRLERREVLRLLGYRPRARPPAERVERVIGECLREAEGMLRARGCYAFRKLDIVPRTGAFRGAEWVASGVCTIGPRLPARVTEYSRSGDALRALVIDAAGSAAVEAATDAVNALICETIEPEGLHASRRISPGYPSWPIEGQREIFALLPSDVTGVTLNSHGLMSPRKSVSFAVGAGREIRRSRHASVCSCCSLLHCRYRRPPEALRG